MISPPIISVHPRTLLRTHAATLRMDDVLLQFVYDNNQERGETWLYKVLGRIFVSSLIPHLNWYPKKAGEVCAGSDGT